jgi:hypothetical protein
VSQRDGAPKEAVSCGGAGLSAASAGPNNKFFSKEEQPLFIRTAGAVQGD